jgi:hypothetical protein
MSQFSTTSTGDKPADSYKKMNLDTEASLDQKIEDFVGFISSVKLAMMTTKEPRTGHLVSRAMALAAQVC